MAIFSKEKKAARERATKKRALNPLTSSTSIEVVVISDDDHEPEPEATPQAPFPFLKLPLEIRFMIYRRLLVVPKTIALQKTPIEDNWLRIPPQKVGVQLAVLHPSVKRKSRNGKKRSQPPNPFSPGILSACLQTYQEADKVFYGENTFGLSIWEDNNFEISYATLSNTNNEDEIFGGTNIHSSMPLDKVRRWEILVEVLAIANPSVVIKAVRKVGERLAASPLLASMKIRISSASAPGNQRVLRYLGLLRNVQSVQFDTTTTSERDPHCGPLIESQYAHDLKTLMEGNTPVDRLTSMYEALESFALPYVTHEEAMMVSPRYNLGIKAPMPDDLRIYGVNYQSYQFSGDEDHRDHRSYLTRVIAKPQKRQDESLSLRELLSEAEDAKEDFDVDKFKRAREVLVETTIARMADTARKIYAHDRVEYAADPVSTLGAALIAKGG